MYLDKNLIGFSEPLLFSNALNSFVRRVNTVDLPSAGRPAGLDFGPLEAVS